MNKWDWNFPLIFDITLEFITPFFFFYIAEILFLVLDHIIAHLIAGNIAVFCIFNLALTNISLLTFMFFRILKKPHQIMWDVLCLPELLILLLKDLKYIVCQNQ